MTRKLLVGLSATILSVFSVSAQYSPDNARISSLGGIYTVEDIANVYRYAANMKKYQDDIQITFSTPMLGIKSIGEAFSVGAYVRDGLVLDQNFYARALGQVNSFITDPLPKDLTEPTYMPHALLGLSAGPLTLGFDLFLEWANTRYVREQTVNNVTTTTTRRLKLTNPGFIGSILLDVNNLPISLKAGFAFPGINGLNEVEGPTPSKNECKSEKGLYMEFGGEVGLPLGEARLTLGADYILEAYAFKLNSADPANEYSNNRLAIFGSLQKKAFNNGLWALQYQFGLNSDKNEADAETTPDVTITTFEHILSAGAETGWDNVWIFDKAFVRGGMGVSIETLYDNSENATTTDNQKDQKDFLAAPTVGFGVNKGPFELDLRINLAPGAGGWSNLFTGPGVAVVTGTLRF